MRIIDNYSHEVASHCETGSIRNLIRTAGLEISEPMVFGLGSGPAFYHLFFAKGPSTFPLLGIRNKPGSIVRNVGKLCGIEVFARTFRSTDRALLSANALLDSNRPAAACVDMFYMTYLPSFMQIHAPFHFIILVGREGDRYAVSDPYHEQIGVLAEKDLRAGWETHAPFGKDNFLVHVGGVPDEVDWRSAIRRAIRRTCRDMLLPPVVRSVFGFVGVMGIRRYARSIRLWSSTYRGVVLREGILFDAVAFEAQGTGGGAFRLMYGAFLQEAATLLGSERLDDLAGRMIENGKAWRDISRKLVVLGKKLPADDVAYGDWHAENATMLDEWLVEMSRLVSDRADTEERLFRDLASTADEL